MNYVYYCVFQVKQNWGIEILIVVVILLTITVMVIENIRKDVRISIKLPGCNENKQEDASGTCCGLHCQ